MKLAVANYGFGSGWGVEMTSDHKFETIFDTYHSKILRYLSRIVGPVDAEDLAQEVFDKINRGLSRFHGRSSLSTWIYRIATNTAIDRSRSAAYKYERCHDTLQDQVAAESSAPQAVEDAPLTEQMVIRKEMSDCVNEFIDNLPPDYRTVIVLSELEGFANKEIAQILGISVDNVKIRLHRARASLRRALQEGCDFYYTEGNTLACDRKQVGILPKIPE